MKRRYNLGRDDNRIDPLVRHSRVSALPFDNNLKVVGGGHDASDPHAEKSSLLIGPIVHSVNRIGGESFKKALFNHDPSTAAALFSWLEDEVNSSVEVSGLGEVTGSPEEHGCVSIMSACVHDAVMDRAVTEGVVLLKRQGVHVGPQGDGFT